MSTLIARLCLPLLLLLTLTGCLQASPAQESKHTRSLERWFPDPGAQALAVAAELGDAAEVRRLMKDQGVDPDKHFSPEGMPLLAWPIYTKNPAGLKAMLENGADPNARYPTPRVERYKDGSVGTYYKNSAMVWAAKEENSVYLRLLLDNGGDPNTRNSNDETLLFQAYIWQNQWQNVQLLVERGANVNEPNSGGISGPIIELYAGFAGFSKVYWLLENNANPGLTFFGDLAKPPSASNPDSYTINSIFWYPVKPGYGEWQQKCQIWLLKNGYTRPPLSDVFREMRQDFGFTTDEKNVPLPDVSKDVTQ